MIRELKSKELKEIYKFQMVDDFPSDELKPLSVLLYRQKKGMNLCLGFFKEGQLLGYAILEKDGQRKNLLLDYFAVKKEVRFNGIGSEFIKELGNSLKSDWNSLFIESERDTNEIAKKRIEFYKKNGALVTDTLIYLYHVDYCCLVIPLQGAKQNEVYYQEIASLYRIIYPWVFRKMHLKLKRVD